MQIPRQTTHSQSQGSSAFGVDEEESRDCSYDLNSTIAQGGVQGLGSGVAGCFEDRRAVKRDDCKTLGLISGVKISGNLLLIPHIC